MLLAAVLLFRPHEDVFGDGQVDDVMLVDQSPVGRSPRSNPVTYVKAFDAIRAVEPDLYIVTGDLFYGDIGPNDPDAFRRAYEETLTRPAQSALYRSAPIAYVWDDHDYAQNDADAGAASGPRPAKTLRLGHVIDADGVIDQAILARDGDRVVVDFTGTIDGEEFQGGTGKEIPVVLGQGLLAVHDPGPRPGP